MWWKWILRAALAVSQNEAVRSWVRRRAQAAIEAARKRAEARIADLSVVAGLPKPEPVPQPRLSRLIRTERDTLKPGHVVIDSGKAFRVVRLISSSARETVYEAVEN